MNHMKLTGRYAFDALNLAEGAMRSVLTEAVCSRAGSVEEADRLFWRLPVCRGDQAGLMGDSAVNRMAVDYLKDHCERLNGYRPAAAEVATLGMIRDLAAHPAGWALLAPHCAGIEREELVGRLNFCLTVQNARSHCGSAILEPMIGRMEDMVFGLLDALNRGCRMQHAGD